ncbi:hypothetical protein AQUCO_00700024v1 [Aquilegia coerulea]|uniref:F-box domain-containing protein n=1 Tax=Aquilegia coerulea TaxID=218851 RepID=A0A2G5EI89_AQUCA|nr:hypothetical protein AQUCO_00700024v1 [Aquilegia coerulea]
METGEETEREEEILPKVILPSEIILFDILSRVDVKSLIRFRSVSKSWNTSVTDPFFIDMHMNRSLERNSFKVKLMIIDEKDRLYSLDFEKGLDHAVAIEHPVSAIHTTRVCGSCNGLLCMLFNHNIYIWNPTTRKCRKVPCLPSYDDHIIGYGFGYNRDIDDYVVVRVSSRKFVDVMSSIVDVYSLQRDSWRTVPDNTCYKLWDTKSAVFVEGSLHWVGLVSWQMVIIAFDIGSEKFRENGSVLLKGSNMDVILYDPKTKTRSFNHIRGPYGVAEAKAYVESIVRV